VEAGTGTAALHARGGGFWVMGIELASRTRGGASFIQNGIHLASLKALLIA
jgi:hypothetical protein